MRSAGPVRCLDRRGVFSVGKVGLPVDPVAGGPGGATADEERAIMRFTQRGVIVIGVALAGLAPAATTMAATPVAAAGRGTAPPAQRCVHITATIRWDG